MIIRVVLSLMLLVIVWVALASHKQHRGLSKAIVLVCASAIAAVWMDSYIISFANWAGVGRGTDLVLYITWPVMFFGMLMLYARVRRTEARLTQLARAIAIAQADIKLNRPEA
jgi:small membrane protein